MTRVLCLHRWVARPDKATRGQSRYECERCGCWGHVNLKHGGKPRAYRKVPHDLERESFFLTPEGF